MNFKFQNSKIEIHSKNKSSSGFKVIVNFANELTATMLEYTQANQLDKHSLTDDITKAGQIVIHQDIILVSLGDNTKFTLAVYQKSMGNLVNLLVKKRIEEINLILSNEIAAKLQFDFSEYAEETVFNIIDGLYYFDDYKSKKTELYFKKLNLVSELKLNTEINNAVIRTQGIFLARNLGNSPANVVTPEHLSQIALDMAKLSKKVSVEVFDTKQIKKLGMNLLLAVAQGANSEPRLIKLEYNGLKSDNQPIILIGKGVTFDSGGISLKPREHMEQMKYDMCGAATLLGVFNTVVQLGLKVNLVVIIPACENMPSGGAIKPGDIVQSMSGKYIEIVNTDAEGRLILADALTYAKQFNPKFVIDIATLTGACIIALGNVASALYTNDEELLDFIYQASEKVNDRVWRMPLWEECRSMLEETIADLANVGSWGGKAGSAVGAAFLREFTDYRWAHLDIAGVAWPGGKLGAGLNDSGATGRPFNLLVQLLKKYAQQS